MSNLIGKKVKALREEIGLTLEQLAEKIGSQKSYIWELENKPLTRPSAEKIFKLAHALNVTADYLMDDTCNVKPTPNDHDVAFFSKYQKLDERDKEILRRFMDSFDEN